MGDTITEMPLLTFVAGGPGRCEDATDTMDMMLENIASGAERAELDLASLIDTTIEIDHTLIEVRLLVRNVGICWPLHICLRKIASGNDDNMNLDKKL